LRQFVARYNEAAVSENAKKGGHFPLFSAEILKAVGGENQRQPNVAGVLLVLRNRSQ
jgi:hypothetical protein